MLAIAAWFFRNWHWVIVIDALVAAFSVLYSTYGSRYREHTWIRRLTQVLAFAMATGAVGGVALGGALVFVDLIRGLIRLFVGLPFIDVLQLPLWFIAGFLGGAIVGIGSGGIAGYFVGRKFDQTQASFQHPNRVFIKPSQAAKLRVSFASGIAWLLGARLRQVEEPGGLVRVSVDRPPVSWRGFFIWLLPGGMVGLALALVLHFLIGDITLSSLGLVLGLVIGVGRGQGVQLVTYRRLFYEVEKIDEVGSNYQIVHRYAVSWSRFWRGLVIGSVVGFYSAGLLSGFQSAFEFGGAYKLLVGVIVGLMTGSGVAVIMGCFLGSAMGLAPALATWVGNLSQVVVVRITLMLIALDLILSRLLSLIN